MHTTRLLTVCGRCHVQGWVLTTRVQIPTSYLSLGTDTHLWKHYLPQRRLWAVIKFQTKSWVFRTQNGSNTEILLLQKRQGSAEEVSGESDRERWRQERSSCPSQEGKYNHQIKPSNKTIKYNHQIQPSNITMVFCCHTVSCAGE